MRRRTSARAAAGAAVCALMCTAPLFAASADIGMLKSAVQALQDTAPDATAVVTVREAGVWETERVSSRAIVLQEDKGRRDGAGARP